MLIVRATQGSGVVRLASEYLFSCQRLRGTSPMFALRYSDYERGSHMYVALHRLRWELEADAFLGLGIV